MVPGPPGRWPPGTAGVAGVKARAGPSDRPLRVMQVTHDLGIGGLPRVVVTLCRTMDRARFHVSVLCLNATGPLAEELAEVGVPVHQIPGTPGRPDYFAFLKVARVLREQRIDVVHTHNTQPLIDAGLAALLARVPTHIHTDHGREFPDKRRYMWAERLLSRFCDHVVGVSEETSRDLVRWEKLDPAKVLTIRNGIDGSQFDDPVDVERKREELEIESDAPVVGAVTRLTEEKGVEYLLRAVPALRERLENVVVVIAGYGPLEGALRRMAAELGVGEAVRFLGPRRDVPELLQLFDVFALPSLREGLPMGILEALAAGCPVVATAVGGVPAALEAGRLGLLVEPARPEELTEALTRVLSDGALRDRLSWEGRRAFRERFSARAMTRAYEELYLGDVREDGGRRPAVAGERRRR